MKRLLLTFFERFLRLFPRGFRQRFGEEMRLDFEDHLEEAGRYGTGAVMRFFFKEARDLPGNLLRAHMEEKGMLRLLRSQPLNHSLRGAVLFGAAFALTGLASSVILENTLAPDSFIARLQVAYFDVFHTEHGLELIAMIPTWISSLLAGLLVGAVLAILFGEDARKSRLMLAGMLGWFLHDAVHQIIVMPVNLTFFLGTLHTAYLTYALNILSGAFLGLIFVAARDRKPDTLRWMAAGSVVYPLVAYGYMRLLFQIPVVESPWLFIALVGLVVIYLASIFLLALRSDYGRRAPWMIIAGAAAIVLSRFLAAQIIRLFFASLIAQINANHEWSWSLLFKFAAMDALYGLIFGLLLGLVLGYERKSRLLTPPGQPV